MDFAGNPHVRLLLFIYLSYLSPFTINPGFIAEKILVIKNKRVILIC